MDTSPINVDLVNEIEKTDAAIRSAIELIRVCMERVDPLPISGAEKSSMVKSFLNIIVTSMPETLQFKITDDVIVSVRMIIERDLLQSIMDTIISASKGSFDFSKNQQLPVYKTSIVLPSRSPYARLLG